MDDLFLAVLREGAETNLTRQREALIDDEPLHALEARHRTRSPAAEMKRR